ncbi:MAG TPA: hypothetical protein VF143_08635, partial [Candidatus Nanopelagicales bacterium]
ASRELKAAVVREALARFADVRLGPELVVEPVGDPATGEPLDWLGWRTRGTLSVDAAGRAGMRAERSHEVVVGPGCPQLHAALAPLGLFQRRWEPGSRVGFVAPTGGAPLRFEAGHAPAEPVTELAVGASWRVAPDGFWQVHPGAAGALVQHVAAMLGPRPGERLVDLYAGVGLFGLSLSRLVGSDAQGQSLAVTLVEGDRRASELAAVNAGDLPVTVVRAPVDRWVARPGALAGTDLVVLDPPRVGAGAGVVGALAAARPRAVAYVACDPVALARDVATFQVQGYRLEHVVALDLFPATHHVECVALLVTADAAAGGVLGGGLASLGRR